MNTALKDKLYNITFTLHDLTHKPIPNLYYEIKNGKELVKKGNTNGQGEISLKYVGGNTLTVFVRKDIDKTMKKIGEIHTPSKNIKVKLISPKMKFDVTLLPHQEQGKYWRGTYKVKSGDTLSKIAKEHHTTVSALLALNPNIKKPNRIYQNEEIDIVEGNADAIIKLDANTTVKVPPVKKTGTVAVDRKSKSSSSTSSADTKSKTTEQKVANTQPQPQPQRKKEQTPSTAPQQKAAPPPPQKIEVQQEHNEDKKPVAVASLSGCVCKDYDLIWGAKVNCSFRKKLVEITKELWGENKKIEKANMLMAIFAWETGEKFKSNTPNQSKSGGTGLIQIMPTTFESMTKRKATIEYAVNYWFKPKHGKPDEKYPRIKELASLTELQYLDYVRLYLMPLKGKDVPFIEFYLQVLYPASVGREEHTVFAKSKNLLDVKDHTTERVEKFSRNNMDGYYLDEKGILHKDGKKDGKVMKSEIAAAITKYETDGLTNKSDYKDHEVTTKFSDYEKSMKQGEAEKSECKDGCSIKQVKVTGQHVCIAGKVKDGFIIDENIKLDTVNRSQALEPVKIIVLHRTHSPLKTSTAPNLIAASRKPGAFPVHFWIGSKGEIYQSVSMLKKAVHIGDRGSKKAHRPDTLAQGWGNENSIGIEVIGEYRGPDGKRVNSEVKGGSWEAVTPEQAQAVACLLKFLLNHTKLTINDIKVHEKLAYKTTGEGQTVYDAMLPYLNQHS